MSAPPVKREVLVCRDKRRMSDELLARAVAQTYLQHPKAQVEKLWIYKCPHCNGWHTTRNWHGRYYLITRDELYHGTK